CVLLDQIDDIGGQLSFKMEPVYSPWVVLVASIFVRCTCGNDDDLAGCDGDSFPAGLYPSAAFHVINNDMLAAAAGAVDIVKLSPGVVPDICNEDLFCHRVKGQEVGHDLLWQNDQPLTIETLAFAVFGFLH